MSSTAMVTPQKIPSTFRLTITLFLAGLLSGLIIVTAYQATLPRITANRAAALQRAVFEVLPGAERMEAIVLRDRAPAVVAAPAPGEPVVYAGYGADGALVGYAIPAEGPGFQDTISLLFGWNPATRRIVGLQILESRETPGLGDKIYKDQRWLNDFRDLAGEPKVVVVKGGTSAPNEIDAITGATISSKAVASIVNGAGATWFSALPAEGPDSKPGPGDTP
jgi:electron transport complex protein RnfG